MAKISEIIYNIKNLRNKGEHTDDQKLNDRQLEYIVNHFRAELASQRANNNKSVEGFYQEIEDLKLSKTSDFKSFNPNVTILKSKNRLPEMATAHDLGYIIQFVGTRDEFLGFQQSSVHTFNIDLESPYIQNTYFLADGYLYIATKDNSFLREVYVRAIFSNPRVVNLLNNKITIMSGLNWDYPLPDNLIGSLNNMIINNEYRWMHMLPSDHINDTKDAEQ